MKKCFQLLFSIILLSTSITISGQQIERFTFSSAGSSSVANDVVLDWSFGQIAVNTISNEAYHLTQGFHQANPNQSVHVSDPSHVTLFSHYPNPTTGIINFDFEQAYSEGTILEVYDLRSRLIQKFELDAVASSYQLDLSSYSDGSYLVKVIYLPTLDYTTTKILKVK